MAEAQIKELLTTAKTLKDNKQDAEAINALEKLIATGKYCCEYDSYYSTILMLLITDGQSNEIIKIKEDAIKTLAELYAKQG